MDLNKMDENLKKMPLIETKVLVSKDKKYIVHKTIITDIKPYAYWEKVISEDVAEESA